MIMYVDQERYYTMLSKSSKYDTMVAKIVNILMKMMIFLCAKLAEAQLLEQKKTTELITMNLWRQKNE